MQSLIRPLPQVVVSYPQIINQLAQPLSIMYSGMGFLAYAKINPFAAAQGNAFAQPSPRSPKNPFQTTSPVHNPFMSFVDKKEEYWKMMSTNPTLANTSSIFGFNSDTVQNTMFNSRGDAGASTAAEAKSSKSADATTESVAAPADKQDSGKNSPASGNESDSGSPTKSVHSDTGSPAADAVIVNGEEGEECVFQVRAKMFRLSTRESVAPVKPALSARNGAATAASTEDDSKKSDDAQGASTVEAKDEGESKGIDEKEENEVKTPEEKPATSADKETTDETKPATTASTVNEWVEVGTGPLRVLKPSTPADGTEPTVKFPRVVMRREYQPGGHGTKLILNEVLHKHATVAKIGEKALRLSVITTVDNKAQPVSFLLRTKLTSVRFEKAHYTTY